MASDIRPVFPEERLLFELISGHRPFELLNKSIWAMGSRYYVDGKPNAVSTATILKTDADDLRINLEKYKNQNTYGIFNEGIKRFVAANREHLANLVQEAISFIVASSQAYPEENLVISFSGGKDSTVTADLVVRALSNPYLVHIFGNTTLEFPTTLEYVKRFKESHPLAIFKTAENTDQSFYDVAEEIGPPARLMRWCCSMFKTGPITRAFNSLYGNQSILTFQGVRGAESASRKKYNRIEDSAESVKIQKQKVALPIFSWKTVDVWLYILAEGIDFNSAYRLGYERVGCWCCPNNNERAELLAKLYMPEEAKKWRNYLLGFAHKVGKPDPEVYVDEGWWKARQGGNGLAAARSVKVDAEQCATEEHAVILALIRPFSDELVNLFTPVGIYAPGIGNRLLEERIFLDPRTKEPLISIFPFSNERYDNAIKIRILDHKQEATLLKIAKYQVRKFNACRQCLKCESLCKYGAISIIHDKYSIDEKKCTHCRQCVTDKYLENGCLMGKYLRTLKEENDING